MRDLILQTSGDCHNTEVIVNEDTGEVLKIVRIATIADRNFLKVNLEKLFDLMATMTQTEIDVFLYFLATINVKRVSLKLQKDKIVSTLGVKENHINSVLNKMIKQDFMRLLSNDLYIINPSILRFGFDDSSKFAIYRGLKSPSNEYLGDTMLFTKIWIKNFTYMLSGVSSSAIKMLDSIIKKQGVTQDNTYYFLSQKQLAKITGLSEKTLRKALKELCEVGFIAVQKGALMINPDCVASVVMNRRKILQLKFDAWTR